MNSMDKAVVQLPKPVTRFATYQVGCFVLRVTVNNDNRPSDFTGQVHRNRCFSGSGWSPEMHRKSGFDVCQTTIGYIFNIFCFNEIGHLFGFKKDIRFVLAYFTLHNFYF